MTPEDPLVDRRAGAVFKYGILRRFPVAFASRVGAWSAGRRVVFLDGCPGPGQLDDGSPGSPLLIAREGELAATNGTGGAVTGIFVESDRSVFANLREALAARAHADFDYRLFAGELADHLAGILRLVPDSALFAMVDPAHTALDRNQLTDQLLARGLAPTEAVVHLGVTTLARVGHALRRASEEYNVPDDADAQAIDHLDRFLGGPWWHREVTSVRGPDDMDRAGRAAQRVAARLAQQVARKTGFRTAVMPVRLRPGHLPRSVLVFFARGRDGFWEFADTIGHAGRDWHEQWRAEEVSQLRRREERHGQLPLFALEDTPVAAGTAQWHRYESRWVSTIERNVLRLLAEHGPFALADRVTEVYGDVLGLASADHVRQAVGALHTAGLLADDASDERWHARQLRLGATAPDTGSQSGSDTAGGAPSRPAGRVRNNSARNNPPRTQPAQAGSAVERS